MTKEIDQNHHHKYNCLLFNSLPERFVTRGVSFCCCFCAHWLIEKLSRPNWKFKPLSMSKRFCISSSLGCWSKWHSSHLKPFVIGALLHDFGDLHKYALWMWKDYWYSWEYKDWNSLLPSFKRIFSNIINVHFFCL